MKTTTVEKKPIAIGFGYKNPHQKNGGTRYEYPIFTKQHLQIVKNAGGEIKK